MKKHFSLSCLLIFLFVWSQAQNPSFEFGFDGGINFNSAHGTGINKKDAGSLRGFVIGGHVKKKLTKSFGIKALLQYEQNGWAYRALTFENLNGNLFAKGDILFKLNYVNIPIVAEYSFGNKTIFYTNAGLFLGFLLNNKTVTKPTDPAGPDMISSSYEFRKSSNIGIVFAAGMKIPLSTTAKLCFGINNNLGLKNINKPAGSNSTEATIKSNSFSILTGISFAL
jgi:hypothetical protein